MSSQTVHLGVGTMFACTERFHMMLLGVSDCVEFDKILLANWAVLGVKSGLMQYFVMYMLKHYTWFCSRT